MPLPSGGGAPVPLDAKLTYCRKRPTVTRYLSSRKELTDAGSESPVAALPLPVYVREYVPPGTVTLVQQLSWLDPQSVVPTPLAAQLGGATQTPPPQAGVGQSQGTGAPHWPSAPHVSTPLPAHCVAAGVQGGGLLVPLELVLPVLELLEGPLLEALPLDEAPAAASPPIEPPLSLPTPASRDGEPSPADGPDAHALAAMALKNRVRNRFIFTIPLRTDRTALGGIRQRAVHAGVPRL